MDRALTLIGVVVGMVVALGGAASPVIVAVIRRRHRDADEEELRVVAQGQTVTGWQDAVKAIQALADEYKGQRDDYHTRLGKANKRLTDLGETTF